MLEKNVNRNVAEIMFENEICERYGTDDLDLAKAMFNTNKIIHYIVGGYK